LTLTHVNKWFGVKSFLAIAVLAVLMGCASKPLAVHPLDGTSVVLEGRWNDRAKEEGQIVCAVEPKVVDVLDIGQLTTPKHEQPVRVTAVLHWRGMEPQQRQRLAAQAVQLIADGYIIRWPEAHWEPLN